MRTALATALAAGGLALVAPSPADAVGLCGTGVSLDWLRGNDTTEVGRDEVYIRYQNGARIWPLSSAYVSVGGDGHTVDVNHCARVGTVIELWDVDDIGADDLIGRIAVNGEATGQYPFCCGGGGNYTLDVDA